jgi:hypothetical protein
MIPHRSSPYSPPQIQSDPKATGDGADKDDTEEERAQKTTSGLLDEDTAAYRKSPDESRCQSPVDISALRQHSQVATAETSDSSTVSSTATPTEIVLQANSSTPDSTSHQAHQPIRLSGVISANAKSRILQQLGGSTPSRTTESMASIISVNPPSHTAKESSSALDIVDELLRTPHSAAMLRQRALGSRPSAGPIPHSKPAPTDNRTAGTTKDSTVIHNKMKDIDLPIRFSSTPKPPVSINLPKKSAKGLSPEPESRAGALKKELLAKKLQSQKVHDSNTPSPAAASTGFSIRGAAASSSSKQEGFILSSSTTGVSDNVPDHGLTAPSGQPTPSSIIGINRQIKEVDRLASPPTTRVNRQPGKPGLSKFEVLLDDDGDEH